MFYTNYIIITGKVMNDQQFCLNVERVNITSTKVKTPHLLELSNNGPQQWREKNECEAPKFMLYHRF